MDNKLLHLGVNSKISKRTCVANFGQRSNILNNKSCLFAYRMVAYVHWSSGRPLRTVSMTLSYSAEKHMETYPHSQFRRIASISSPFSQTREGTEVHVYETMPMLHVKSAYVNLVHLLNAVEQTVWLKLMPNAPIERRKRLVLDDYPIHRALGAKPVQWKSFATRCKLVHIIWAVPVHNQFYRDENCVILPAPVDCTLGKWWVPHVTHPYMTS